MRRPRSPRRRLRRHEHQWPDEHRGGGYAADRRVGLGLLPGRTGSARRDLATQEEASADSIVKGTGTLAERRQLVHGAANEGLKAITDTTAKPGDDDAEVAQAIEDSVDCDELAGDMSKHYPSSAG